MQNITYLIEQINSEIKTFCRFHFHEINASKYRQEIGNLVQYSTKVQYSTIQ